MSRRRVLRRGVLPPRLRWFLARIGLLSVLVLAVMLTVRCTRELTPSRGEGSLVLALTAEPGASLAAADSVRVWVLDGQERVLVGPVVAPFDTTTASFDISLRVPAGDDRAVRMQLEGSGARGRGVIADGEARGITVPAAGTADALLRLRNAVPRLEPFDGQPGDLQTKLRWSAVPGASGYRLYGLRSGCEERMEDVADTVVVVSDPCSDGLRWHVGTGSRVGRAVQTPGRPRLSAVRRGERPMGGVPRDPAALDTTWFRVSAILHGGAASVTSDPVAVSFDWIDELPRVTAVVPAADSVGVPDSVAVEVAFSRPMDPSSLGDVSVPSAGNAVTLRVDGTTDFVGLAVDSSSWSDDGSRLRLQPITALRRDARYLLQVTSDVRDLDGRPLDQSPAEAGLQGFESRFDTEHHDPLRVTRVVPEDGAAGVPTRPVIEVQLNRGARPATVSAQTVLLADSAGSAVACTVTLPQPSLIRVAPGPALRFSTRYQLVVTTGVRDLRGRDGEPLDQDPATTGAQPNTTSFRTVSQPSGPGITAVTPADGAGSVPLSQVVRVRFTRPIQVASVGREDLTVRRLPVGSALTGPFVPSADRTEFTFTTTQFERGVSYRVVVKAGGFDLQGNPVGIRDDSNIPFDRDSTVAGYQDFTSLFRVEDCPEVVSVEPAPGSEEVSVNAAVTLRFSLPMARSSVTAANLGLSRGTTPLSLQPVEWTDSTRVILRPVGSFTFCDTFTVFADTSLRSTRGSRLDQEPGQPGYQPLGAWFVTAADGSPPRVASCNPGADAVDVAAEAVITIRFTKPVNPTTVSGTSFFLQKLTPGSPPGPALAAIYAISSDSLEAALRPDAPLENGAQYQVTVKKWIEDRCGQPLDQRPEEFGNQDFTSTFYTAAEQVPPSVEAVAPALNAVDVPLDTTVEVTFTEPMGSEGTLIGAFSLSDPDGLVAGETLLSPDRMHLVFTPGATLRPNVRFDVRVDTTATDLAGNHLDFDSAQSGRQPFTSFFTTVHDVVPPRVTGSVPAAGDTSAVEVTVHPEVVFSKVMNPDSVAAALRLLDAQGATVPGVPVVATDRRSAFFVPSGSLLFSTRYTLEVGTTARDSSGNGLDQDPVAPGSQPFRLSFHTRVENIAPRVRGLVFDDGPPVPVTSRVRVIFDEAIDSSTVTTQTVRLSLGGSAVDAAVSLSAPDTALLVPAVPLLFDTTYAVTVAGVGDLHGNLLDQDPALPGVQSFIGTFATVPDLGGPRVTAVFPPADSSGVDPRVVIEIRFSEPVAPATVVSPAFALYNTFGGGVLPGAISHSSGDTLFFYQPDVPLARGAEFLVQVTNDVTDPAGHPLDQDPAVAGYEPFTSSFQTGTPPVASAGPGICDPSDSSRVVIDASASADSSGTLTRAEIDWGDGNVQTIDLPDSSSSWPAPQHTYLCTDARGCNGLDDDGDGQADETGTAAGACDESYRVIVRVRDEGGLWSDADTTGVSFCNLEVLGSTPADGATGVDTLITAIRLRFTRALDPTLPHPAWFRLETAAGDSVAVSRTWDPESLAVVLVPADTLLAGATYRLRAVAGIRSLDDRAFDQDPCTVGFQSFLAVFETRLRLRPAPPSRVPSAPRSSASPAQEGGAPGR